MIVGVGAMLIATAALSLDAAPPKVKRKRSDFRMSRSREAGECSTTSGSEKEPAIDLLTGIRTGRLNLPSCHEVGKQEERTNHRFRLREGAPRH